MIANLTKIDPYASNDELINRCVQQRELDLWTSDVGKSGRFETLGHEYISLPQVSSVILLEL